MKDMHGDIAEEEEKILEVWRTHYMRSCRMKSFPGIGKLSQWSM